MVKQCQLFLEWDLVILEHYLNLILRLQLEHPCTHHIYEEIGYFDEELIRNQDDDFNYRVIKSGGKIWFESDISLKYYVRGICT